MITDWTDDYAYFKSIGYWGSNYGIGLFIESWQEILRGDSRITTSLMGDSRITTSLMGDSPLD